MSMACAVGHVALPDDRRVERRPAMLVDADVYIRHRGGELFFEAVDRVALADDKDGVRRQ